MQGQAHQQCQRRRRVPLRQEHGARRGAAAVSGRHWPDPDGAPGFGQPRRGRQAVAPKGRHPQAATDTDAQPPRQLQQQSWLPRELLERLRRRGRARLRAPLGVDGVCLRRQQRLAARLGGLAQRQPQPRRRERPGRVERVVRAEQQGPVPARQRAGQQPRSPCAGGEQEQQRRRDGARAVRRRSRRAVGAGAARRPAVTSA
mmetsp:Transcript_26418/g.74779  ORF Transcript_26418/g.74779 Transcript_26418/m.74779 type:complete len:202 (+) Transcript_26418:452-1057(+)